MMVVSMYGISIVEMKDHRDICEALKDLDRSHFTELGGALGLSHSTCGKFSTVDDLVASWLRREDDVLKRSGEPTWSSLADTLQKIGQTGISRDISSRYTAKEDGCNTDQSNSRLSGATGGSGLIQIDTGKYDTREM